MRGSSLLEGNRVFTKYLSEEMWLEFQAPIGEQFGGGKRWSCTESEPWLRKEAAREQGTL